METGKILKWNDELEVINPDRLMALKRKIDGRLIIKDDDDYDNSRMVWNGMIDRSPAIIVKCKNEHDIQETLKFATENEVVVTVKGGGHHVAGGAVCDHGLMIDLSDMNAVTLDEENKQVSVQGGATWGEVDQVTQAKGLATPGGLVSDTGVAGLTLGGGLGWLRRKYGLACDNLVSAEIITANGDRITADNDQNADLFWAIKGGGPGFGIVSTFNFRLYQVGPEVMSCIVFYPARLTGEILRYYRSNAAALPPEASITLIYGSIPENEPFPEKHFGEDFILIAGMYAGAAEEGEKVFAPYRKFGEPIADFSGLMPYTELQQFFDEDYPKFDLNYYWKSLFFDEVTDEVIEKFIELGKSRPSPLSTVDIWLLGGAIDKVKPLETAYAHRGAQHLLGIESNWEKKQSDSLNIEWTRKAIENFLPLSGGSSYVNFEDIEEKSQKMAGGKNFEKLQAIKKKYDPKALFSHYSRATAS
ncbi:FAD-binding oxidoreductase [Salegentibacter sp.]|uniref:FAD-binding oxidoreductase n=1 Tax=Salegentibacter sp. TaxID=1903072 RepID=UPI0035695573